MRTEQFNRQDNHHDHIDAPEATRGFNDGIVPGYVRERIAREAGQRIVARAIQHRSIDLTSFTPQETIFTDFDNLREAPQTD